MTQHRPISFRLEPDIENPVAPRDSATVILARDGDSGLEVFMLERSLRADFVGGAYVFPGGTVDTADTHETLLDVMDGAPGPELLGFWACAIRETFEESGALLARRDGALVTVDDAMNAERPPLNAGHLTLLDFARRYGLRLAGDLLLPWARWITPSAAPKRYDTRFFVAALPDGNRDLLHDDVESRSSAWIRPSEALQRHAAETFPMIFPTRVTITQLSRFESLNDLLAAASHRDMAPVAPEIVQIDGAVKLFIPGDPDPYDP